MKKFIKVSFFILGIFTLFIAINKLVYRDMVSVKDYEINHLEEIVLILIAGEVEMLVLL